MNEIPKPLSGGITSGRLIHSDPGLTDEGVTRSKKVGPSQVPRREDGDLVEKGTESSPDESQYMEISRNAYDYCDITFSQQCMKTKRCRFQTFGAKVWVCQTPTVEELVYSGFFYRGKAHHV